MFWFSGILKVEVLDEYSLIFGVYILQNYVLQYYVIFWNFFAYNAIHSIFKKLNYSREINEYFH